MLIEIKKQTLNSFCAAYCCAAVEELVIRLWEVLFLQEQKKGKDCFFGTVVQAHLSGMQLAKFRGWLLFHGKKALF